MERTDVLAVMSVLRGAYPQFYRGIDKREAEDTVNLWADLFSRDNPALVLAAVKSFIEADSKGFPPVPGQIKEKLRLLTEPEGMTELEAWGLVSRALKNGLYGAREEFERLPVICRRIVGSAETLREWSMLDPDHVQSVISSHFQRAYRNIAARERELDRLPAEVKRLAAAEKFRLEA